MNETENLEITKSMKNAGVFFFLVMILQIPMTVLVAAILNSIPEKYFFLVSVLMTQGYLLFCGLIYMAVTKTRFRRDLQLKKFRLSSFFLSLLVLITASPMATWLNACSQLFAKNEVAGNIFEMTELLPAWLGVIVIGCLPGFIEEFLYRGIIFSGFRKRSVLTGVLVSAFSFGVMHMNFNQIMYAIYLGLIFALVVEATGSIVSTMILHMLFNAVNTLYLYILPKMFEILGQFSEEYANANLNEMMMKTPAKSEIIMMLVSLAPFAIGGLVLTILLLKQIAKINGRTLTMAALRGNQEEVSKTKPVNVWLLIGWAFCLINAAAALFM